VTGDGAKPLVSICMPTRNRGASLRDSVRNICAQDYPNLDIFISDNASEDDTESVCRELMREDPRIRYVRHPVNIGLHGNHNFCMDQGRGEFLCIFHDHDRRVPGLVSEYVAFLQQHRNVGVVCSDWDLIDDAGERIGIREYPVKAVTRGMDYIDETMRTGQASIAIAGAMARRSALGSIRFVLDAPIGFGDFPIWFQLAETADVGHISKILWSWRQNDVSLSARPIEAVAREYAHNIGQYCNEHLERWPDHVDDVNRWRRYIRRYLFWALTYEVGLHFRDDRARTGAASRSLFEIMNYRLTPEQFRSALAQMKTYRSGAVESLAYAVVSGLIGVGFTKPLAWATRHHAKARALLRAIR
jgi:glycosyltransferase involved in cell wall biosynthesis